MLKKFFVLLIILTISLFSLSGCYDIKNIDDLAYVIALGIDVGSKNDLKLTFQIAKPTKSGAESSESSGGDSGFIINTVECSSIDSGFNLINSFASKEINLSHCRIIVISEELAEKDISEYIYTLMNKVQIRPSTNVIVSKCSAEYYLRQSKPSLDKIAAKYYDITNTAKEYTGYTDDVTLNQFFSSLRDNRSEPYAILGRC